MKKLINDPADVVNEALQGIAAAHGDLVKVMTDPNLRWSGPTLRLQGKVGLVSGGGSGHEPMHGGFVGAGMLDAACPGEVFTSPTPDQMLAATKAVNGGAGRAAHRQELHRRRAELRDGRRAGPGGGHRSRGGRHQRRRGRAGQPVHRRPPRRRHDGAGREDLRAPRPSSARRWPRWPTCAGR